MTVIRQLNKILSRTWCHCSTMADIDPIPARTLFAPPPANPADGGHGVQENTLSLKVDLHVLML